MKCIIPEISWHNRDPVLSIDIQVKVETQEFYRITTGGTDSHVLIWRMIIQEGGAIKLDCVCDLSVHQKAVNVVKFSPSGEFLASGDDESVIMVWRMIGVLNMPLHQNSSNVVEENDNIREVWSHVKILRGHLNDVYDLSWSPDSTHLLSGSVDNSAIIWDVVRGKKTAILPEAKNFVQGVSWDPENKYIATLSSDGKLRTYCWRTHKMTSISSKGRPRMFAPDSKPLRIFHDDTLKTFFRRLSWSPDGLVLSTPAGIVECSDESGKFTNVTWLFPRSHLSSPCLYYPSANQASMVTRWSPVRYQLRPDETSVLNLPYRMILAVATKSMIILYDTQHAVPIGLLSNMHYTKLTDMAWSSDGRILVASSTDGYCSVITFGPTELGDIYEEPESKYTPET